jgi:hypothetical protein
MAFVDLKRLDEMEDSISQVWSTPSCPNSRAAIETVHLGASEAGQRDEQQKPPMSPSHEPSELPRKFSLGTIGGFSPLNISEHQETTDHPSILLKFYNRPRPQ